jgi:preprotein translocase subunit YajC
MTLLQLLPFAAVLLAVWLLMIRPAKARRDEQTALVASLAPGARIMTTAGVFGTVRSVAPQAISVEIAPGVVIEMVPQAVGRLVPQPDEADPALDAGVAPAPEDQASGTPGEEAPSEDEEAPRG